MEDNDENIFVEFDYNNIFLIDPNRVVNSEGKIKERTVKQERLVMYANLECKLTPRTKLAVGASQDDRNQTINIGSINFLKQGDKEYLDNSYTDELTGKNTLKGDSENGFGFGVNQIKQNDGNQTLLSDGKEGSVNNGLLGITSININTSLSLYPTIQMSLEDIKGRAMFESGQNSPYAAFFNFPYPKFYLTIKGYYGKATRLPLMLQTFTSRYDTGDGNFKIDLKFYTYKFTMLAETTMGYLLAVPHMYRSRIKIQTKENTSTNFSDVENTSVSLGYKKISEMYGEYKSKGIIPDDFPELTLVQLRFRLEQFMKNTLDTFTKENLDPLTNVGDYNTNITDYSKEVFLYSGTDKGGSWFNQYMDTENFFILNDEQNTKVYTFRKEFRDPQKRNTAISNLKGLITKYNTLLDDNETLGKNGTYTIGNKPPFKSEIPNPINYKTFNKKDITINDVDFEETYIQQKQTGILPTPNQLEEFKTELITQNIFSNTELSIPRGQSVLSVNPDKINYFYTFEGKGSFMGIIDDMLIQVRQIKDKIQDELTESLSSLLKSKGDNGIGFVPTIRNVLAVVFANAEAFLRLLDDTHREAWNVRDNRDRQASIFNSDVGSANPDNLSSGVNTDNPVYPWPEFIVKTTNPNGEKYEKAYPGDDKYNSLTKGYRYDIWPEVEFVEEYLDGKTRRGIMTNLGPSNPNGLNETNRVSVNAIEFPIGNDVYQNKEKVKYIYEIYERLFLTANYTGLVRINDLLDSDEMGDLIASIESTNIIDSLSNDNPFLIQALKSSNLTGENFLTVLRTISNDGQGVSWNNLIRGIFNTGYIKNDVDNASFTFLNSKFLLRSLSSPTTSVPKSDVLSEYLKSSKSNVINITDTYPFTDLTWVKNNLQEGNKISNVNDVKNTSDTLFYNNTYKVISNFEGGSSEFAPITNYNFKEGLTVPQYATTDLRSFYKYRGPSTQFPTEGNLNYFDYSGLVSSNQTVSILNTPYFINSLQESADKIRSGTQNPFTVPAYLFINSLPLATLREKFTTNDEGYVNAVTLDYIFGTIKKFGSLQSVPYAWVLKIGSEWHRYKTFIQSNVDILSSSWVDFDENSNYDPQTSSPNKQYSLNINGSPYDMVMEETNTITVGGQTKNTTSINSGFYPKLINDFTFLYEGNEIFTTYSDSDIQSGIDSNLEMTFVQDAVINYSNTDEDIRLTPWSVLYNSKFTTSSFIIPSNGSLINQTKDECINDSGVLKFDIKNNQSMYNGSVRLFWGAPNYGYFDNSKVVKPEYNQHMKKVFSDESNTYTVNVLGDDVELPSPPQNFSINGLISEYSDISETFSVFEKDVMDQFETKFLDFSKSRFDISESSSEDFSTLSENNSVTNFKNFHEFFIQMCRIPKVTLTTGEGTVSKSQNEQMDFFSNVVGQFLEYNVYFKYGNPGLFDKRLFYSFANNTTLVDGYTWEQYSLSTPNALPTISNTITLANSKISYPNEWRDLELYVGFSDIPELVYDNNGSYITDFFIDNNVSFNSENIKNFSPIIKMYATQKLKDSTMTSAKFGQLIENYINDTDSFQNKITNNLITKLRSSLPDVDSSTSLKKKSAILGGEQIKVELWELFKALNDKWISGHDFSTETVFEGVLFLDRASRDIGNEVFVDIYKLKDLLHDIENASSMDVLTFVTTIIMDNGFNVLNVPSYFNFYNVNKVVKNPTPKPESSLDSANTLFGTFESVDYRESSTKLVCLYGNTGSSKLSMEDNGSYRFKSDAPDLRKPDSGFVDDINEDKDDFAISNKVVGFNVDIGPQNQSIFTSFRVSQNPGKATYESIEAENALVNQYQQSNSNIGLYNIYKNRSYSCVLSMMGNAMLQPTMYFNLRHVPMFNGPYMITRVDHTINPGQFETIIEGIRQPFAGLPRVDNYIQTLRNNLLNSILENNNDKIATPSTTKTGNTNTNVITQKSGVANDLLNQPNKEYSNTSNCEPNYNGVYSEFEDVVPSLTSSSYADVKVNIVNTVDDNSGNLEYIIFASIYLGSNKSNQFISYDNNFSGISIKEKYSQGIVNQYMSSKLFYCVKNNTPYVAFNSLLDNVGLLKSRWEKRVDDVTKDEISISKFLILNSGPITLDDNVYTDMDDVDKKKIESLVKESINLYDIT